MNTITKAIEIAGNECKRYVRQIVRRIYETTPLRTLLEKIGIIDYDILYNYEEEVQERIKALREKLKHSTDPKEKSEIEKALSAFSPADEEKYLILIEEMLRIADELKLGLGVEEDNSFPYFYNGFYWEVMSKSMVKELIAEIAMKSGFNYYKTRVSKTIEALYKQFTLVEPLAVPEIEKDTVKINLKNGTFIIKGDDQKLVAFDKKDFFKYQLPFEYKSEAKAPRFQTFLDQVLPEKEAQMVLAEYLGYIFTRNLKLEKCLILIGTGSNGKSVVYDIVTALLGERNVCSYTLSNLCNDNGYFRAQLTNYLVNYSSELGGKGCNHDIVKKLISNEPLDARSPFGDPFILRNYGKFIFNTNLIPKDIEQTDAYHRRLLPLEFKVTIPEEDRDVNLAKSVIESGELSGIFNWVLEGLNRLLKQKNFTESKLVIETLNTIKTETNSVAMFVEDNNYEPSNTEHEERKVLFAQYSDYCKDNNYHPTSSTEFSRRLRGLGYRVDAKKTNNQTWVFCRKVFNNSEAMPKINSVLDLK